MNLRKIISAIAMLIALAVHAECDPNFYIYLCFGQSNMEGAGQIETIDYLNIPDRFQMMAAVDYSSPAREMYNWYSATPPLVRQSTGLCPVDYFGRTMAENLPEEIKVGVIVVAIGGCRIEHLDKDFDPADLENEADWFKSFMSCYDNAPYTRLLACAKEAQKQGVIKGMLLHQGESNTGDQQWPDKVKKIYDDLLADLELNAEEVPLIAGQVVTSDMGGACGSMNAIINTLPQTIDNCRVVSAANLEQKGDGLHFTSHSYRVLGCRYATQALALMGIDDPVVSYEEEEPVIPSPSPEEGDFVFDFTYFNPSIWENGTFDASTNTFTAGQWGFGGWQYDTPIDLSGYKYLVAELNAPQSNGLAFRVFDTASYWEQPYSIDFGEKTIVICDLDGMMKPVVEDGVQTGIEALDTSHIYRVGFWAYGYQPISIKQVFATNNNPYNSLTDLVSDTCLNDTVYSLQGIPLGNKEILSSLATGCYIYQGHTFWIR